MEFYEVKEDYEVVQESVDKYLTVLLTLPKEVYKDMSGIYKLSLLFMHPTYVKIEYIAYDKSTTEPKILSALLNLNNRFPNEIKKIKEYLSDNTCKDLSQITYSNAHVNHPTGQLELNGGLKDAR